MSDPVPQSRSLGRSSHTIRTYRLAAAQRFEAAEYLHAGKKNLEATYLAGYTVECALKALILSRTEPEARPAVSARISRGRKMHEYAILIENLPRPRQGEGWPPLLLKRLRRSIWSTDIRYDSGKFDHGETRAILNTAAEVLRWVEGEIARNDSNEQ